MERRVWCLVRCNVGDSERSLFLSTTFSSFFFGGRSGGGFLSWLRSVSAFDEEVFDDLKP